MGIGDPPRSRKDRRPGDNVVSLRPPDDEYFDLLSPLLEEAASSKTAATFKAAATCKDTATFRDRESPRRELLSKENARLRSLAVGLSNLLGNLPVREWEDAGRSHRNKA